MKKIYITKPIHEDGITLLKDNNFDITVRDSDELISKEELKSALNSYDGMISMLSDPITEDLIEAAEKTQVIANYAVGYNNIDVEAAQKKGIMITNTPDVLTEATAELAMALLLSSSRRIVEGDRFVREKKFKGWGPLLLIGKGLDGKKIGIVGMGRIGQAFARMCAGFNCEIMYTSRSEKGLPYRNVSFRELVQTSDVISIHVPLNDETRHMFTASEFSSMKKGVVFINTSRGPVVNENDMVDALKSGIISYAGLDVFEFEPEIHESLYSMDNVVILPHIGSATEKARSDMAEVAAQNIIRVLSGESPLTPVW